MHQKTEFDDSADFNEVRTVGKKSQFPRKCCWNLVKGLPVLAAATKTALCERAERPTGRPAQRSVGRAGQAGSPGGLLTGVSASADFCALPRIHEAWKGCEDDFRLCTLLAKKWAWGSYSIADHFLSIALSRSLGAKTQIKYWMVPGRSYYIQLESLYVLFL